jgi:rsbT co-antagonist protein RsbR
MKLLLDRWLAPESRDDPLRDTQARLLQRFALVMLAAALLSLPVSLVAQSAVERLIGVTTSLALLVLLGSAILLLRHGRLVLAGLLIIVSTAASAALNMSTSGIEGSRAIFVLLIIPIVLGGLLGDRRLLLAALAICTLVPAGIIVGEIAAPNLIGVEPDTYDPLLTFITFVLCAGILTVLVGYFGLALQRALQIALGRERELDTLRASLERQVADRTAQLTRALDEVRARSTEQAALLETLEQQREVIRELSVPVLPLQRGTLAMPLIGALDSTRLRDLQERALAAIERTSARRLLLDITGVPIVDTQVVHGLIGVVQAARLLGTEVLLVGIRPEVAQTIVGLGLDLRSVRTYSDIETALSTNEPLIDKTPAARHADARNPLV